MLQQFNLIRYIKLVDIDDSIYIRIPKPLYATESMYQLYHRLTDTGS